MGLASLLSGNVHLVIMLLIGLHSIDFAQGLQQSQKDQNLDNFEEVQSEEERAGPVTSFFINSWKNNAFNKRNF